MQRLRDSIVELNGASSYCIFVEFSMIRVDSSSVHTKSLGPIRGRLISLLSCGLPHKPSGSANPRSKHTQSNERDNDVGAKLYTTLPPSTIPLFITTISKPDTPIPFPLYIPLHSRIHKTFCRPEESVYRSDILPPRNETSRNTAYPACTAKKRHCTSIHHLNSLR